MGRVPSLSLLSTLPACPSAIDPVRDWSSLLHTCNLHLEAISRLIVQQFRLEGKDHSSKNTRCSMDYHYTGRPISLIGVGYLCMDLQRVLLPQAIVHIQVPFLQYDTI
ncbi:hypothetical protein OUZ56_000286 [Daphnia magna]|uniref:Uncharacterized protein n=1 Tax=Daphnia magna TaxID=35525 RepID=A0ABQ9ZZD2_9CRUS|nr:hypothetical protein OUZ56_000286 [Daphnia magna]